MALAHSGRQNGVMSGYQSPIPFEDARIGAAAVYCSDGRYGEHFDDFLQQSLGLPRYDRLAVPGGAAALAGHFATYRQEDVVVEQLEFLIGVHHIRRVILVAHQDCAFYTERLEASPIGLAEKQIEDMGEAARRVRAMGRGNLVVDAWFAHRHDSIVTFEQVPV